MAYIRLKTLIDRISREDLYFYYIEENHNQKETCDYFNIPNLDSIYKLLSYYNISKPISSVMEGRKKTLENIPEEKKLKRSKKLSEIHKGKILSEETKKKISEANKGKFHPSIPQTEETKRKKSKSLKEHYSNMSEEERKFQNSHIKKYFTEVTLEKLNERRLKKIFTLENKSLEDKQNSYLINLSSRGIESPTQEFLDIRWNKIKAEEFLINNPSTYSELIKRFNVTYECLTNWLEVEELSQYLINDKSRYENEIKDFLDSLGVSYIQRTRKIISPQELDFYIPSKKLAIEFNGSYWHSNLNIKDKNYHLNKSKMCEEKGIRLIHIWEYEWNNPIQKEKIIQLLKIALGLSNNKIYARDCSIKLISNKEAKELNTKMHLQGHRNAQVTYGLFYKGDLVQLMSFSKSKYNRNLKGNNSWEIIRGCPGSNTVVIGGVSKLFTHFVRDFNPDAVFSYCDFNKFDGRSYEALGMKFIGYTGPDMKYLMKNGEVINRSPTHYKYNKENSIALLYGAGSKKYLWDNINI